MNDPLTSHLTPCSTTDYEDAIDDSVRSDDIDKSNTDDIDYSIRTNQIFDESARSSNDAHNDSFFKSDYGLESAASNDPNVQYSYDQTSERYQTCTYDSDQSEFFESEDDDVSTDQSIEYDETDFPPGHITTLSEMEFQSQRQKSANFIHSNSDTDVNPSILPTYFFCPITQCIMQDPVLTPDGNTFERRALLRYMVLYSCDPLTGRSLRPEEIKNDDLVRGKIEKCRREAWVRYVMSIDGGSVIDAKNDAHRLLSEDEVSEVESDDRELNITKSNSNNDDKSDGSNYSDEIQDLVLTNTSSAAHPHPQNFLETYNPENSFFDGFIKANNRNKNMQRSDASTSSSSQPQAGHGWNTPLGVHRILCKPPGLVVTSDYHRRSAVVKRKVVVKRTNSRMKKDKLFIEAQTVPSRGRNMMGKISPKKKKKANLMVVSRDLILKCGSHVDIVETIVHGGRVRGKIVWEEEMIVEFDDISLAQMNTMHGTGEHEEKQTGINSKKRTSLFRRKNNKSKSVSTDLCTASPNVIVRSGCSPSPPPLTLVTYSGWISLEWAGNNNEREKTAARRLHPEEGLASDEDNGPWSQPLQLGVYRVHCDPTVNYDLFSGSSGQLPLSDAADSDRNITHLLVENQYVEIVETQVVVMKTKITSDHLRNRHVGINAADGFCGVRTVRCRCIVPILINPTSNNAPPQKQFRSGWISLCTDNRFMGTRATPLQQGAYIIISDSGCIVTEGNGSDSKIKSILPRYSCVEVVTTQLRFEDNEELLTCHCGKEVMYIAAAVRALIASGGYITLLYSPIGTPESPDNICNCGTLIQRTIAQPVPIGMYKICHPNGVIVTSGIKESQTVSIIDEGKKVEVLQTAVDDRCIRGRICLEDDHSKETIIGWINLFESPEMRWAEYMSEE